MAQTLILIPGKNARGGVTTYFNSAAKHLAKEVAYLERGCRSFPYRKGFFHDALRLLKDYANFIKKIAGNRKIRLVHINTSLDKNGAYRDSIYVFLTKMLGKKAVVFYHGWDENFAKAFLAKKAFFRNTLFKADASIVLAKEFGAALKKSGYKREVYVETTIVDTELIKTLSENQISQKTGSTDNINILFLARIEKEKGIYIALEAFRVLQEKYPDIRFTVVGDGQELENLRKKVLTEHIRNVFIEGFVQGHGRIKYLLTSNIYILPTTYKEGMPTSILEAMAFGLPVITRPIAGIKDIMQQGKHGYLLESTDPKEYAQKIEALIMDRKHLQHIAVNNYNNATQFYSSNVTDRIKSIYNKTLSI